MSRIIYRHWQNNVTEYIFEITQKVIKQVVKHGSKTWTWDNRENKNITEKLEL